jgi:hypothetical protein
VLICEIQLEVERLGFFLPGNDFVGKYIKQSMCQPELTPGPDVIETARTVLSRFLLYSWANSM